MLLKWLKTGKFRCLKNFVTSENVCTLCTVLYTVSICGNIPTIYWTLKNQVKIFLIDRKAKKIQMLNSNISAKSKLYSNINRWVLLLLKVTSDVNR